MYWFLNEGDIELPTNPFIPKFEGELIFPEEDETVGYMNRGDVLLSRLV